MAAYKHEISSLALRLGKLRPQLQSEPEQMVVFDVSTIACLNGSLSRDILGPYGVPDHPLGENWYAWNRLNVFLNRDRDYGLDYTHLGACLMGVGDPQLRDVAHAHSVMLALEDVTPSGEIFSLESALPRLFASMDYRRSVFLGDDPPKQMSAHLSPAVHALRHSLSFQTLWSDYRHAFLYWCNQSLDPITIWNRLHHLSYVYHLALLGSKLRMRHSPNGRLLSLLDTHINTVVKDLTHV